MYQRVLIFLACTGLALLTSTAACAAQDCERSLLPDVALAASDLTSDLSYLAVVSEQNFPTHKANSYPKLVGAGPFAPPHVSGGIALPIATELLHASETYAEFSAKREQAYAQHQFRYKAEDLAAYFKLLLPRSRLQIYARCTGASGLRARLAQIDRDFVVLGLSVDGGGEAKLSNFSVTGADLQGTAPTSIGSGQEITLVFIRHLDRDFRLSADADGMPISAFAPRFLVAAAGPSATTASCAGADKVVQAIYQQMLGRKATPAELAPKAQRLRDGTHSVRQLAEQLVLGSEYVKRNVQGKSYEEALRGFYRHVLARDADAEGFAYYVRHLRNVDHARIAIEFFRNPEYAHRFGEWSVPGAAAVRYCGATKVNGH